RHRRSEGLLPERLQALHRSDQATAARAFLELAPELASDLATVGQALNLREEEARTAVAAAPAVVPIPEGSSPEAYTTEARWRRLEEAVVDAGAAAHRDHPLAPGLEMESLRTGLALDVPPRIFRWCVDRLAAAG